MKTSKIKVIKDIKEYNGQHGTVFYHLLEMDNGDKINIGKKKKLQVGFELNYEIIGDIGQHEYTKAKTVNPEFKKGGFDVKGVQAGHSVNCAIYAIQAGLEFEDIDPNMKMENKIYKIALIMHNITSQVQKDIS